MESILLPYHWLSIQKDLADLLLLHHCSLPLSVFSHALHHLCWSNTVHNARDIQLKTSLRFLSCCCDFQLCTVRGHHSKSIACFFLAPFLTQPTHFFFSILTWMQWWLDIGALSTGVCVWLFWPFLILLLSENIFCCRLYCKLSIEIDDGYIQTLSLTQSQLS